ncbi:MAG: PHP domain-containing protein [Anaerolineae bacterium]|nr:PHP domain-containing protein [Anaerolineae bacterium]
MTDSSGGSGPYGGVLGQLVFDLHSHSSFSDGDNDVEEMVRAAEAAQLKVYAVTDHLFGGDMLWKSAAPVQSLLEAVIEARSERDVEVLVGVEGVVMGPDGEITVSASIADRLDLVLVDLGFGTHGVFFDAPVARWKLIRNSVDATIRACEHRHVNIFAHPFNLGRCEPAVDLRDIPGSALDEVAAAFAETGTAFEIMNQMHYWFPNMRIDDLTAAYTDIVIRFKEAGVRFSVGSDAHRVGSVGNLLWCATVIRCAGLTTNQMIDPRLDLPLNTLRTAA